MATLFLCFFCRTNDKKCRKNVFAENIDVYEWRTDMKTSKTHLLIQRIFLKISQKVILFCRKRLTIWYVSAIIICVARATGTTEYADVAELADALDSGSSSLKRVWVQIPSSAPIKTSNLGSRFLFFIILSPYFYHLKSIHKNTVHTANKPWYALRPFSLGSQSSLTQPLIILPILLR